MYAPRLILMKLGNSPAMSIPAEKALSMVLMASCDVTKPQPAKKAAARDLAL
jgi:hypothetical protein